MVNEIQRDQIYPGILAFSLYLLQFIIYFAQILSVGHSV